LRVAFSCKLAEMDEAQALRVLALPLRQLVLQAAFLSVLRFVHSAGRTGDKARSLDFDAMLALVVARNKVIATRSILSQSLLYH
jgi:hypothetical protein